MPKYHVVIEVAVGPAWETIIDETEYDELSQLCLYYGELGIPRNWGGVPVCHVEVISKVPDETSPQQLIAKQMLT